MAKHQQRVLNISCRSLTEALCARRCDWLTFHMWKLRLRSIKELVQGSWSAPVLLLKWDWAQWHRLWGVCPVSSVNRTLFPVNTMHLGMSLSFNEARADWSSLGTGQWPHFIQSVQLWLGSSPRVTTALPSSALLKWLCRYWWQWATSALAEIG